MTILHLAKNMSVKLLLPPYFLKKLLYKVVDYPYCFRFCGLLLIAKRSRTGVPSRWNSIAAEPPAFGHTMTSSFWKPKVETIWFPFSFPAQCTEVRFTSLLSGGFTTMAVINPPEKTQNANMCSPPKFVNLSKY